jgi:2-oxoglutarate ferredoxin oxidoreductase subunit gamma
MGDILARAALRQYQHVAWFPIYNTMMRGGDSECCLVFSQKPIPSPVVYRCNTVIAMGAAQATTLEDRVEKEGLLMIEGAAQADQPQVTRTDIKVEYVPAVEMAHRLGASRNANMVMLGAYVGLTNAVAPEFVKAEIDRALQSKALPESAVAASREAFLKGIDLAQQIAQK